MSTYRVILENCAFPCDGTYTVASGLTREEACTMAMKMDDPVMLPDPVYGGLTKYRACIDEEEYDGDDEEDEE